MNIFDIPPLPLKEEQINILAQNENVRIERIISRGQVTDWYDQNETEFVVLLDGNAKLEFENNNILILNKGDSITIKPHEKHRVSFTSVEPPCIWLCIFY